MKLDSARWPDLAGGAEVLLLPLGACEQHGPHLPFHTDAAIADAVARGAAGELRRRGVAGVCAPVLAFGASGEHQHFDGTVSIGHDALGLTLLELGRSASCWARRLVFLNAHGGNLPTVSAVARQLRQEGRDASWLPCQPSGSDAHAGRTETSLMLAIAPETVRLDAAVAGPSEPIGALLPRLREHGVIGVSPNGVLGDPTGASAEEGAELLAGMIADVVDSVLTGDVPKWDTGT